MHIICVTFSLSPVSPSHPPHAASCQIPILYVTHLKEWSLCHFSLKHPLVSVSDLEKGI
jgi:hypothetical protein